MDTLSIGQVARRAGVGVETVRFYERKVLAPEYIPSKLEVILGYSEQLTDWGCY